MSQKKENSLSFSQRCACPNNRLFILALTSIIIFLSVELIIRIYNMYRIAPLVDIPSHFFAGIALGTVFSWIISLNLLRMKATVVFVLTFISACLWELMETLEEMVVENPPHLKDFFFWDGVGDILVTTIGGGVSIVVIFLLREHTKLLEDQNCCL